MIDPNNVRAKKHLGQHFLKDLDIAQKIVGLLDESLPHQHVVEVGPGTGVLTQYLKLDTTRQLHLIDVDEESIAYLQQAYTESHIHVVHGDFMKLDLAQMAEGGTLAVIGNFPYNVSSQLLFHILDYRDHVTQVSCMLQREVARRIASPPGNKDYGILSVLLQAWYDIRYAFTVDEHVFNPPPKVKSGVLYMRRNAVTDLGVKASDFKLVVKTGFNNRRKTLRNALKPLALPAAMQAHPLLDKRAEQLGVAEFIELTKLWRQG